MEDMETQTRSINKLKQQSYIACHF